MFVIPAFAGMTVNNLDRGANNPFGGTFSTAISAVDSSAAETAGRCTGIRCETGAARQL